VTGFDLSFLPTNFLSADILANKKACTMEEIMLELLH
jgi:hypothetical protein